MSPLIKESFLTETITSGHRHNSEYLVQLASDAAISCEESLKSQVRSVVTKNTANMGKMRTELQEKVPNKILSQDLHIPEVKEQVVQDLKYFRETHLSEARYEAAGGNSLVIPHEIRWNTIMDCLESYMSNWSVLVKIVRSIIARLM